MGVGWGIDVYTGLSNGSLFSGLLIQEQAGTSDSGKGEGLAKREKMLTRCREAVGPTEPLGGGQSERGGHARAHAQEVFAGDEYDNWTRDGESVRARAKAGRRERRRERGEGGQGEGGKRSGEGAAAAAGGEKGGEGERGEDRSEAERSGRTRQELFCAAASPGCNGVLFPERSPRLRAPLHNKIYFKTQLKETGRLRHSLTDVPGPSTQSRGAFGFRGDSEAREHRRRKKIYKRGGGEGLGGEEGEGPHAPSLPPSPPPLPTSPAPDCRCFGATGSLRPRGASGLRTLC